VTALPRILLTGAGSGIGLATAAELAGRGYGVVGVVPNQDEREVLATECANKALAVQAVVADLVEPASRQKAAEAGPFWAVINNAGYLNAGRLEEVSIPDARDQLEVMVLAPLDLVQRCLPAMNQAGSGRIVNVTSSASHVSTPLSGWYAACKAALRELNDALRLELDGTGIAVIDVEPGGYQTNIWKGAAQNLRDRRPPSGPARGLYDSALEDLDGAHDKLGDPHQAAVAIADALEAKNPPTHVRIGPGATRLRVASDLMPDKMWDKAVHLLTRRAQN
jgi:short-subunit dehydrogenase